MYERFTDRARKVMQLANQEAQRFNHEYVGTEHVLLGLIKEGSGVAANVLKNLDVDLRKIRNEVEKIVQAGPDMVTMGKLSPATEATLKYPMPKKKTSGTLDDVKKTWAGHVEDQVLDELDAAGIRTGEVSEVPGVARSFDFADPYGNPLGFYQDLSD